MKTLAILTALVLASDADLGPRARAAGHAEQVGKFLHGRLCLGQRRPGLRGENHQLVGNSYRQVTAC